MGISPAPGAPQSPTHDVHADRARLHLPRQRERYTKSDRDENRHSKKSGPGGLLLAVPLRSCAHECSKHPSHLRSAISAGFRSVVTWCLLAHRERTRFLLVEERMMTCQ